MWLNQLNALKRLNQSIVQLLSGKLCGKHLEKVSQNVELLSYLYLSSWFYRFMLKCDFTR